MEHLSRLLSINSNPLTSTIILSTFLGGLSQKPLITHETGTIDLNQTLRYDIHCFLVDTFLQISTYTI